MTQRVPASAALPPPVPRARAGLRLGPPDDAFEREADRVAGVVIAGGNGAGIASAVARTPPPPTLQRLCPECEEEALQRQCAACAADQEDLQRKGEAPAPTGTVPAATAERIGRLRGGGVPLPPDLRGYFEPRLGRDLAPVRLHTGAEAAAAAREVRAQAFTVGPDIAFSPGAYDPASGEGRRLLAHELVHTVQQGAAGAASPAVVQRRPPRPEEDPIHQPIIEQYRREEGLPPSGIDPVTGQPVGPPPGRIKYGPWPGDVAGPAAAPELKAVKEAVAVDSCGKVTPGMPDAQALPIRECIYHARFVNVLNQASANMAKVASPYAPGLAALYQEMVKVVLAAGLGNRPTGTTPKTYSASKLNVAVSPGVTLPVASFDLTLEQDVGGVNGAAVGSGIELNEASQSMLTGKHADVERTMYHEGFHFLSGIVSSHNRQVRKGLATGTTVSPELDTELVAGFETEFRAAAEPIWTRVLAEVPKRPVAGVTLTPSSLSGIQWLKVSNEIVTRVEEVIYMNLREGRGFSRRFDLPAMPQAWLLTPEYWDSGVFFVGQDFAAFLSGAGKPDVEGSLLPVVQGIQRAYLRRRAATP